MEACVGRANVSKKFLPCKSNPLNSGGEESPYILEQTYNFWLLVCLSIYEPFLP